MLSGHPFVFCLGVLLAGVTCGTRDPVPSCTTKGWRCMWRCGMEGGYCWMQLRGGGLAFNGDERWTVGLNDWRGGALFGQSWEYTALFVRWSGGMLWISGRSWRMLGWLNCYDGSSLASLIAICMNKCLVLILLRLIVFLELYLLGFDCVSCWLVFPFICCISLDSFYCVLFVAVHCIASDGIRLFLWFHIIRLYAFY